MLIRIDPRSDFPLYAQIAAQIRRSIAEGKVRVRERLPPARELAASLDVNMHTVLRAYEQLRQEGLLEIRRGRGVVVVGGAGARGRLVELARALVSEARRQGLAPGELKVLLEEVDA